MKFQKFLFYSLATPYQWNLLISAILFVFMFYVLFEHLNVSKTIPSWIDMDKYIRVLWDFVRQQTRFTQSSNILQFYVEQVDFIYIQIDDIHYELFSVTRETLSYNITNNIYWSHLILFADQNTWCFQIKLQDYMEQLKKWC